jgi:dienelactone hydrolase
MMATNPAAKSLAVLELAQAGRFAQIHEMFAPELRPMLTAEAMQAAWAAELGRRGQVASIGTPVSESAQGGVVVVKVPVTCEHGGLAVVVSVTEAGQLAGIQLAPASAAEPIAPWEPPGYADPGTFDEQDLMVGSGPLAVPGTLSLPRQSGPQAAVVLLAGSGPMDRDETIGRNKPFKDLAWGLASAGVAVLRFDKVTYAHPREVNEAGDVTVVEEDVTHAAAAVRLLRAHPAVDAGRVFVLGHSLGGTVAPRVAAGEPSVAGVVILAGGTQPLHRAAVRQIRYLAALDPETAAASQPTIEALTRAAMLADSPELSASTPASELPFGVPASYWLDLRGYKPVEVAAALGKPILILQGGRDFQATVADDLTGWKAGLIHCPDVTIRVYDPDNHLFFPGTGPSAPAEYEPAQHMDSTVVADVASWLTTVVDNSDISTKGSAR